jgi:hypothetical protein
MSRLPDRKAASFMKESKPYVKKCNLTNDKAQWSCWEVHIRTLTYDIYTTVLRRKFIPPLMDIFVDIVCVSQSRCDEDDIDQDDPTEKNQMLENVHRPAIDSIFPVTKSGNVYRNIVEEKVNALLMDEDMMNFYHFNLGILPSGVSFAANYLKSILAILQRYNGEYAKELWGMLKAQNLMRKDDYLEMPPDRIVDQYQLREGNLTEQDPVWRAKIARYLAYCIDGGLLQSHFTLKTFIRQLAGVSDSIDEFALKDELKYLLHARKKGEKYERG